MAFFDSTATTVPRPRVATGAPNRSPPWLVLREPHRPAATAVPRGAVLFGRDGTLIQDVSCNGDPGAVHPLAGARNALAALRAAGFALGVLISRRS
ncbi:hypothetical protein OG401_02605 [Kitasatospora purpeofusca]|uniref:hypothetical protein n=1 Tax=Kitasatospora purpeofusca TaxID=67352 RepID=UPI00225629F1|nr:hypothetical protein [Kitasatospora purpeofusca]MCX4683212.1 hypothetical protein [Kitasatospora purpeofusca]